ncbi:LAMI_0H14114g1_1 [Lachancea mirantina]|uniref:LAMI_0H14114g1_1 n=1 Tax=Lachancea mirantina TaxID=1230905 RepID=A0A1G4KI95_9SACH|nr:LAMI_0H14114g1_1 [Lachancea mirantina]
MKFLKSTTSSTARWVLGKSFVPKATIRTTTFPSIVTSEFSTRAPMIISSKDQKPTVISSDNEEVETVSGHIRV